MYKEPNPNPSDIPKTDRFVRLNDEEQTRLNQERFENPQPGDWWWEHCVLYYIVHHVKPNGDIAVLVPERDALSKRYLPLEELTILTREEFTHDLRYATQDGFIADVLPGITQKCVVHQPWHRAKSFC